ncbi:disease resistance N [Chlorella sorokiniana]|uniref:Disease resistance N n=1 Tax=Chlorella sorokiniana TaxID=3076 RepID=A0A2P6TY10_CHLSO|nr:disease resistance N [Chlorella sorokiniana]|eukprot:PRW58954.1 disease resistance N [Chlorella sorokiniana]
MQTRSAASRGAAGFAALPDDLVLAVLEALPLADRCGSAALVCGRFHALATHPSLLHAIELTLWENEWSGPAAEKRLAARLDSLCTFLVRHAVPHLRRLVLRVEPPHGTMPWEATCAALKTLLFRLAAHCSAYGGVLEELSITGHNLVLPLVGGCFAPLATLKSLKYDMGEDAEHFAADFVAPKLAALTGLQELWVTGREQQLSDGTVFPPAVTRLHLGCYDYYGLPASLSSLKRLQYFSVAYCPLEEEDLEPLALCPALTQLTLESCMHIPASLSQLTQLRVLRVEGTPEYEQEYPESRQALLGALCHRMEWVGGVPAEVGSLPQLANFCWRHGSSEELQDLQLPAGAWLASLRQLALPLDMAAASLQRLTAARQLECLVIQPYHPHWQGKPTQEEVRQRQLHQAAVLAWAVQHPRLSRLGLDDEEPEAVYDWRAALALARWPGRPPLAMVRSHQVFRELGCTPSI